MVEIVIRIENLLKILKLIHGIFRKVNKNLADFDYKIKTNIA